MESNNLYPIFIKLDRINTLIVGGGAVGLEKTTFILRQSPQAKLRIVSKEFHPGLIKIALANPNVQLTERAFKEKDLEGVKLLILATNNRQTNKAIHDVAEQCNVLTNEVDVPEDCEFYTAAIVKKGPVKVAISSNGASPTLAKRLRDLFQDVIPDEVELTAESMNLIRNRIHGSLNEKIKQLNAITQVLLEEDKLTIEVKELQFSALNLN